MARLSYHVGWFRDARGAARQGLEGKGSASVGSSDISRFSFDVGNCCSWPRGEVGGDQDVFCDWSAMVDRIALTTSALVGAGRKVNKLTQQPPGRPSKTRACARMPRPNFRPATLGRMSGSVAAWRVAIAGLRSIDWGGCFSGGRETLATRPLPANPSLPLGPLASISPASPLASTDGHRGFQVPGEIMLLPVSNSDGQSTVFTFCS